MITLPGDLNWSDEFSWSPVVQSQEYAISGSLIVEEWTKLAGRPITLQGSDNRSWINKSTVLQLQALAELPGKEIALQLGDGRSFTVIMDHSSGSAFESSAVFDLFPTSTDDSYVIKQLKFLTV